MLKVDLTGRATVITGATGELGRVMARTLARCGSDVLLHFHENEQGAHQLCEDIQELGRRAGVVQADVGQAAGVARVAQIAKQTVGEPDIVVLNAVQQIHPWSPVLEESVEDYESQFRTCVLQAVHLAKAFVPAQKRKGWGRFIGINTECAMQMFETHSAYVAGKRGMDGVLRVLAKEVGRFGVTVNQVAPGWTLSDKDRKAPPDDTNYARAVPLGRRGTDQEIANVVAFLASDLASYVHGAFVPVCGGNVMPCI